MSNSIKTEQWLAVEGSEVLEKRTYKSGHTRYYVKGYKNWGRVEAHWAETVWLANKWFVKEDEYTKIKKDELKRMMFRVDLRMAQKHGAGDWGKERDKKR